MHLIAEASITIRRPLAEVFEFAANMRNFPLWFPEVASIESLDGASPPAAGSRYRELVHGDGAEPLAVTIEVAEYEPNARLVTEGDLDPVFPRMTIEFEDAGSDGATVRWRMDSRNDDSAFVAEILPFVREMMAARAEQGLPRLKELLEAVNSD